MKKWMLLITLFVLAGCGDVSKTPDVFVYTGESENWRVNYISSQFGDNEQETEFRIYHIGEENPDEVAYKIDLGAGASSTGTANLSQTDVIRAGGSCGGCATLNEDDVLQFEVEWNGQKESFDVTYDETARGVIE